MNKKSAPRAAAVIEIGSNNVRMRVSQWAKGTVATLDRLEYGEPGARCVLQRGHQL